MWHGRGGGSVSRALIVALATFGMSTAWALLVPPFGAPDEPAHSVMAAGVVTGQIGPMFSSSQLVQINVPRQLAESYRSVDCFVGRPKVPASCSMPAVDAGQQRATSYVQNYPLLFYWIVGWPILLWPDSVHLNLLMRMAGVLVNSLAVTAAVIVLRERYKSKITVAVLLVLSPTFLMLAGTVNSSGLELSLSFLLWSLTASAISSQGIWAPSSARVAGIAVTSILLTNLRGFSPAIVMVCLLLPLFICKFRLTLPGKSKWLSIAAGSVVLGAVVASVVLIAEKGTLNVISDGKTGGVAVAASRFFADLKDFSSGFYGSMGLNEIRAPLAIQLAVFSIVAVSSVLLISNIRGRYPRVILGMFACGIIALPIAVVVLQQARAGYSQLSARYFMPISLGWFLVPLAAGARNIVCGRSLQRFVLTAEIILATSSIITLGWFLDRYLQLRSAVEWFAPMPWFRGLSAAVLILGYAVSILALLIAIRQRDNSRSPTADAEEMY